MRLMSKHNTLQHSVKFTVPIGRHGDETIVAKAEQELKQAWLHSTHYIVC